MSIYTWDNWKQATETPSTLICPILCSSCKISLPFHFSCPVPSIPRPHHAGYLWSCCPLRGREPGRCLFEKFWQKTRHLIFPSLTPRTESTYSLLKVRLGPSKPTNHEHRNRNAFLLETFIPSACQEGNQRVQEWQGTGVILGTEITHASFPNDTRLKLTKHAELLHNKEC